MESGAMTQNKMMTYRLDVEAHLTIQSDLFDNAQDAQGLVDIERTLLELKVTSIVYLMATCKALDHTK